MDGQLAAHPTGLVGQVHRLDAFAAAALHAVFVGTGALAIAQFGDGEHLRVLLDGRHVDHLVVLVQLDGLHAHGRAADGAHIGLGEADGHAVARAEQYVEAAVG